MPFLKVIRYEDFAGSNCCSKKYRLDFTKKNIFSKSTVKRSLVLEGIQLRLCQMISFRNIHPLLTISMAKREGICERHLGLKFAEGGLPLYPVLLAFFRMSWDIAPQLPR